MCKSMNIPLYTTYRRPPFSAWSVVCFLGCVLLAGLFALSFFLSFFGRTCHEVVSTSFKMSPPSSFLFLFSLFLSFPTSSFYHNSEVHKTLSKHRVVLTHWKSCNSA